jgi:hypothetical protein
VDVPEDRLSHAFRYIHRPRRHQHPLRRLLRRDGRRDRDDGCPNVGGLIPWGHTHLPGPEAPNPATWVRYDDASVQELIVDHLRLAGFQDLVPRQQVRVRRGQEHDCGSCAPEALSRPRNRAADLVYPVPGDG